MRVDVQVESDVLYRLGSWKHLTIAIAHALYLVSEYWTFA